MEEAKAVAETLAGNSEGLKYIGAALAIGLGALGTGLGMGLFFSKVMESLGRNPEASSKMQIPMFLGVAFTEAIAIYSLVVALIILFK